VLVPQWQQAALQEIAGLCFRSQIKAHGRNMSYVDPRTEMRLDDMLLNAAKREVRDNALLLDYCTHVQARFDVLLLMNH